MSVNISRQSVSVTDTENEPKKQRCRWLNMYLKPRYLREYITGSDRTLNHPRCLRSSVACQDQGVLTYMECMHHGLLPFMKSNITYWFSKLITVYPQLMEELTLYHSYAQWHIMNILKYQTTEERHNYCLQFDLATNEAIKNLLTGRLHY